MCLPDLAHTLIHFATVYTFIIPEYIPKFT